MSGARIFISYRRGVDENAAARLFDPLVEEFGEDAVVFDIDTFDAGDDFVAELQRHVAECDVMLPVIGPGWVAAQDRLHSDSDFVRIEIESALFRPDMLVIPIFVSGAKMPGREDLPPELSLLTRRNGVALTHEGYAALVRTKVVPPVRKALDEADARRVDVAELGRLRAENEVLTTALAEAEEKAKAAESALSNAKGELDAARVDTARIARLESKLAKAQKDLAEAEKAVDEAAREAEAKSAVLRAKEAELNRLRTEAERVADLQTQLDAALEAAKTSSGRSWVPAIGVVAISIGVILFVLFGPELSLGTNNKTGDFLEKDCAACPQMIYLEGGTFVIGSPDDELWGESDEHRRREVTIAPFAMAETEVTFDQWTACVLGGGCESNPNPDDQGWGRGTRPVINVSWADAQEYIDWLNEQVPHEDPYRLPSEAEWEFSARAGSTTPFAFGNTISTEQANYRGTATYGSGSKGEYRGRTVPVLDLKSANNWSLTHMHGNVWEWIGDCYHRSYDRSPAVAASRVSHQDETCGARVVRGGSWGSAPRALRSANREKFEPDLRYKTIGFRPAKTLLNR